MKSLHWFLHDKLWIAFQDMPEFALAPPPKNKPTADSSRPCQSQEPWTIGTTVGQESRTLTITQSWPWSQVWSDPKVRGGLLYRVKWHLLVNLKGLKDSLKWGGHVAFVIRLTYLGHFTICQITPWNKGDIGGSAKKLILNSTRYIHCNY